MHPRISLSEQQQSQPDILADSYDSINYEDDRDKLDRKVKSRTALVADSVNLSAPSPLPMEGRVTHQCTFIPGQTYAPAP
jgi:hypothetical protein